MAQITASQVRIKAQAKMTGNSKTDDFMGIADGYILQVQISKKWQLFKMDGKDWYDNEPDALRALAKIKEKIANNGGTIEVG